MQRSRVRIDTRKWLMSKRAPKKYGERVQQAIEMGQGSDAIQSFMSGRPVIAGRRSEQDAPANSFGALC
jgi:hypothetical protein